MAIISKLKRAIKLILSNGWISVDDQLPPDKGVWGKCSKKSNGSNMVCLIANGWISLARDASLPPEYIDIKYWKDSEYSFDSPKLKDLWQ